MSGFRWGAVIVWALLLMAGAWRLSGLSLRTDMTALLPRAAEPMQELLVAQLREGTAARLILIALEGATPEDLAERSRHTAMALRQNGLFTFVANGSSDEWAAEGAFLLRHRYRLSASVTPERFTAATLRASLEDRLRRLGSGADPLLKRLLPSDPTGEFEGLVHRFLDNQGPERRHGVWFSRSGTRAYLVAETAAPGSDLDRQAEAIAAIRAAAHPPGGEFPLRLLMTGPGVFAVQARSEIEGDSWRLSLIAGTLVTLLLATVYRSPIPVALSAIPVLTGLTLGVAAVQQVFGFVHGVTLGFGATLIGEAIDYPAYALLNARAGERLRDTLPRIWRTLRLAVLTTLFGSITLLFSSFGGLSQLGLLTVTGVGAAGFATRWVLPAISIRPHAPARFPRWLGSIIRRPVAGPLMQKVAWLAFAGALTLLAARHDRIWDDDLAHLSPVSAEAKRLDEDMRRDVGAPDVRYLLVVRGETQEDVLTRSEAVAALMEGLVREEVLSGFEVPSHYLPSRRTQERRRQALPDPADLRRALDRALQGLPFPAGTFEPFLKDIQRARTEPVLGLKDLDQSALGLKMRALLFPQGQGWVGLVPLRGVRSAAALGERIGAAGLPGVRFFDLKAEAERVVNDYRSESLTLTGFGLVGITGVLWWGLRSPALVVRVLGPTLMAVIGVILALTLLGERLTLFHLVALLLVIGIGVNYALFFHHASRSSADDEDRRRTGGSLLVCIAATLCAFGTLSLSGTPVLHAIGLTVALGAMFSLILAVVLADARKVGS